MAEIGNPFEEIVENHTAEEVVSWLSSMAKNITAEIAHEMTAEKDPALVLGRYIALLSDFRTVADLLDKKMNRGSEGKPPVVA